MLTMTLAWLRASQDSSSKRARWGRVPRSARNGSLGAERAALAADRVSGHADGSVGVVDGRGEFAGGEAVEATETGVEFGGGQAAVAEEPAEKIGSGTFAFQRIAF